MMKNEKIKPTGTLYVVATPIGNLQDITLRALQVLNQVDRIAVEDTRHAGRLLNHFSINKPTLSLHEFNERERIQQILTYLQNGENIALISDAGTPLISDPGYPLIKALKEAMLTVVPIPGVSAVIAALSVSGLPTDKFIFEGFLTAKLEARRNYLKTLEAETRTLIFFEAPHRLLATLALLQDVFGPQRKAVVARELTKRFESVQSESLETLHAYFTEKKDELKGEVVLLVEGKANADLTKVEVRPEKVLELLLDVMPLKQAATLAAKITGARKNTLYEMALQKK